jgi:hypothetical protein
MCGLSRPENETNQGDHPEKVTFGITFSVHEADDYVLQKSNFSLERGHPNAKLPSHRIAGMAPKPNPKSCGLNCRQ